MTKVTFEVAALADAINKAARVAPSSAGMAFDRAAGIVLDVDPSSPAPCVIRATNTDLYSMEWIDALAVEGKACSWRLSSKLLTSVIGTLPIGSGKSVTLENHANGVQENIQCEAGRMKARFPLMMIDTYPAWGAFSPDKLVSTYDLGGRLAQVEWAAETAGGVNYSGIHLDGERMIATNRYILATVPLLIPELKEPITIPASVLSSILRQTGEIRIGVEGTQLLIMPDEHSQVRTILLAKKYPDMSRIMDHEKPQTVTFKKSSLLDLLRRADSFAAANRDSSLQIKIGREEIAVIADDNGALLGDILEVPGQALHKRAEIHFTPKFLIGIIDKAPSEEVTLGYDISKLLGPVHLDGGSGYDAWVVPRRPDVPQVQEQKEQAS